MRFTVLLLTIMAAALVFSACGSSEQSRSAGGADALPTATVKTPGQSQPTGDQPPVSVAHGAPPQATGAPPSGGAGAGAPDTAALDKKIEQAEAKAKSPKATDADKKTAAAAYVERGNIFYNAGQPMLYKFALRDFRIALRYDSTNEEARSKKDQIEQIYQQMGRPIPELGNEP